MKANEYASIMREELYRQNKDILEVSSDLWLEIADNIENFAKQAVEDYKIVVIEQFEKRIENFKNLNSDAPEVDVAIKEIQRDIEILNSAANATNRKIGG